jgi:hypothetical protein
MVEQQAHLIIGALAGPAGRPSRRWEKYVNSESERVRERKVSVVSDLLEDDQQAREWGRAHAQKPLRVGGAAARRGETRRSTRCWLCDRWASEKR